MASSIIATSDDVNSESITPVRPSWKDMIASYPSDAIKSPDFYSMVSDDWAELAKKNPDNWSNTCAGRMSYALIRSGIKLKSAPRGGSLKGRDGENYWFRVKDLKAYLKSRFKKGDVEYKPSFLPSTIEQKELQSIFTQRTIDITTNVLEKIKGKHGIVVFDVSGWSDASGHFTLWDGSKLVFVGDEAHNDTTSAEYYFWLIRGSYKTTTTIEISVQTTEVTFWELK